MGVGRGGALDMGSPPPLETSSGSAPAPKSPRIYAPADSIIA